jgi:exosortase A-associated hydrolase 1/exosortase A-associated hydrolase 2
MPGPRHAPAEPLFLDTAGGVRFCLFHRPAGPCRGALVYVHPFAEEMNKSRRMAALQARAFAARGVAVLQIDLAGCGDSAGAFVDARWEGWKADLAAACAWLAGRTGREVGLWGLRLGALLALDYAREASHPVERLLLWQPVTNGAAFLTQFLRLRLAGELLHEQKEGSSTQALRAQLAAGIPLDVAGYALHPALAAAIDAAGAASMPPRGCPVHWCELLAAPERPLPPAVARLAEDWRKQGVDLHVHPVAGPAFWQTPEIAEAPALLEAGDALCATLADALETPVPAGEVRDGTERGLAFACEGDWLYGILHAPARPRRHGVLIVVGGPQVRTGSHRQFTLLARVLAAAGIPVLRFDYRGMGDSEGEPRAFDTAENDIRAAMDAFFAAVPGLEGVTLWGLCDGATASSLYAPGDARVRGLALLNPWVRTEEGAARATIRHYYGRRLLDPALWKKIAGGRFDYRGAAASFLSLASSAFASKPQAPREDAPLPDRMLAALQDFRGELLVMLSGADLTAQEFADLPGSRPAWVALLGAPRVTQRTLPKADHTCSRPEWHEQVCGWSRDWLLAHAEQDEACANL